MLTASRYSLREERSASTALREKHYARPTLAAFRRYSHSGAASIGIIAAFDQGRRTAQRREPPSGACPLRRHPILLRLVVHPSSHCSG